MAEPVLAPSIDDAGRRQPRDPFTNPTLQPVAYPKPCAQPSNTSRQAWHETSSNTADTGHDRTIYYHNSDAYKSGSMSSGESSLVTPISSVDLEKSGTAKDSRRPPHDLERAVHQGRRGAPQSMSDNVAMQYSEEEDGDDSGRRVQEEKSVKILVFLSGPCVALSAMLSAWTCISVLITLLTQPVRLCARRPTFGIQLAGLLGPALNLQLRCIYTPLPPHANEDRSYHPWTLVMIHMLSPFVSLGVMFMAWVLAIYWMSSAVVGDPAGMDKRDDGRETVLGLRNWWERFLMRSVQDDQ